MSEINNAKDHRIAVVTGGGTGIGKAIAAQMGALGWQVAVGGRRLEPLAEAAQAVDKAGGTGLAATLDVTDGVSVDQFFERVEGEFGTVQVVINNAATARFGPLDDFSPEEIAAEVNTKLTGSLLMARRAIRAMKATSTPGDILFITSLSANQPWPFHLPYCAANAGVEQAALALRREVEGTGIRVTTVRCGETGGTEFATRELGSERFDAAQRYWFSHGLMRHTGLMMPDTVAEAVVGAARLPEGLQYGIVEVAPVAPQGELPTTWEEFMDAMIKRYFSG